MRPVLRLVASLAWLSTRFRSPGSTGRRPICRSRSGSSSLSSITATTPGAVAGIRPVPQNDDSAGGRAHRVHLDEDALSRALLGGIDHRLPVNGTDVDNAPGLAGVVADQV